MPLINCQAYGVEFSPDGNLLYASSWYSNGEIWQFDLNAGVGTLVDIQNSMIMMGSGLYMGAALQLASDNKIYHVSDGYSTLGVIHNPNIIGMGSNYDVNGPSIAPFAGGLGLPTFFGAIFNSLPSGCDSVATAIITITNSTSTTTTLTECDSYTWSVNNQTYTTSGTYTNVSTNAAGCNHVDSLVLIINNSTSSTMTETACDTYSWSVNNQTYNTSGTYTDVSTNAAGCTHTDILNLIINYSNTGTTIVTACDTYLWNNQTITQSGNYNQSFTNAAGCDSVHTLVATINYSTTSIYNVGIHCDSYTWALNGQTYYTSQIDTIQSINIDGCQHIDSLDVMISCN